ncbi:MAG: folate family ECF transporter S component [Ruminococcus sp.]|uniref:folate family ECF transporter S component n=1 Tax=Ruminococcus sp. TaxID=41978 RepID=UPI0025D4D178|nr:folate family ECF transporter S component [Ruminococcus sp.]MBR5681961.1 folate family ECF transporter S component [Ruminococcus sp.]
MTTNNKGAALKSDIRLFGSTKVLVLAALLIAVSVVGKSLRVDIFSVIRISAETLPILMAGIFFGPFIGAAVGAGADLIGCLATGMTPMPLITVGAAATGFFAGLAYNHVFRSRLLPRIACAVALARLVGSLMINTTGLYFLFPAMRPQLIWRPVTNVIMAVIETFIIYMLMNNKAFSAQLEKIKRK